VDELAPGKRTSCWSGSSNCARRAAASDLSEVTRRPEGPRVTRKHDGKNHEWSLLGGGFWGVGSRQGTAPDSGRSHS